MESCRLGAADIFLGAFQGWRNVTLLGTRSGGGRGRARGITLSRSRLPLQFSTMASFRPDGKLYDGRGVAPDVEAAPAAADFVNRLGLGPRGGSEETALILWAPRGDKTSRGHSSAPYRRILP